MRSRTGTEFVMASRYLTPEGKLKTIEAWRALRARVPPHGDQGGKGYPDPDIVPWTDRLNAMTGVCTLQSCAGHAAPDGRSDMAAGHLWLWLSEPMSRQFDAHAFELAARTDCIEEVSRRYGAWGQEITIITFAGNERGSLAPSMRVILDFFAALADRIEPARKSA